ncbi:hypothetical protein L6R52_33230 [Myxococcota bacterium]|nr:hypothetical protein [Myxococcota bacterium]
MSRISSYLLATVTVLFVQACRGGDDPDRLARDFVDAYYVEYDLGRAMTYSEGTARLRLEEEKRLVDEARTKVAVAQSRTRTYYKDPARRDVGPGLVHFSFALEIRHGSNELEREAVVMVGKRDAGWRVLSFREHTPGMEGLDPIRTSTSVAERDGVRTSSGAPGRVGRAGTGTTAAP